MPPGDGRLQGGPQSFGEGSVLKAPPGEHHPVRSDPAHRGQGRLHQGHELGARVSGLSPHGDGELGVPGAEVPTPAAP